ncbi:hypothetical protein ACFL1Q_00135 [Patescibacteria group bacterium]
MVDTPADNQDPPLVDVKVTNPITYLKKWWNKVIGNEGVEFRLRVKPLTAIAISLVIFTVAFGLGRVVLPFKIPFFEQAVEVKETPTPAPEIWRDTAYTGKLQYSEATNKFYLVTTSAEAITLDVPYGLDLMDLVGRRVLAAGSYNKTEKLLKVADAKNMEVLPKSPEPIPTSLPTPTSTVSPTPTASSSAEPL